MKAQNAALYYSDWLVARGLLSRQDADATQVLDVLWAFGHIAQGMLTSPTYTDTALTPGLTCSYAVLARDLSANLNETAWSSTASATIPVPASSTHVQSIALTAPKLGKNFLGRATVYIYNNLGKPVSGATVTGQFTGSFNETKSATTDSTGKAVLTTSTKSRATSFNFCVQNVTHPSLPYDAAANKVTCASR